MSGDFFAWVHTTDFYDSALYLGDGVCLVVENGVGQHVRVLPLLLRLLFPAHSPHLAKERGRGGLRPLTQNKNASTYIYIT